MGPGPTSWVGPTRPVPGLADWPRGGRPGAAQGPEHGRTAPMAAPRCTMLTEVMLRDPAKVQPNLSLRQLHTLARPARSGVKHYLFCLRRGGCNL